MKQLLILLSIVLSIPAYAKELPDFASVSDSLRHGHSIKLVIDFDACDPAPSVSGMVVYTKPTSVVLRQHYLKFANSPITTHNPNYPGQPILENVSYKMTTDNQLYIDVKFITLPDYVTASESKFACSLSDAVQVFESH